MQAPDDVSFANAEEHPMRDFRDAEAMAQSLRKALKAKSIALTHSESLELIAKAFGFHDWNVLSAAIQASRPAAAQSGKPPTEARAGSTVLPVAPLRDVVFFPQLMTPIFIGRDKTRRAIKDAMTKDGRLFITAQKRASEDDPDCASLYAVGVTANIIHRMALPDGTVKVPVCCSERAAIVRSVNRDYLAAEVAPIQQTRAVDGEAFALMREIFNAHQAYTNAPPPQSLYRYAREPRVPADVVVQLLEGGIEKMQKIFETSDVVARLESILAWLKDGPSSFGEGQARGRRAAT